MIDRIGRIEVFGTPIWSVIVGLLVWAFIISFSLWYTQGDACGSRESCAEETYSGQQVDP